MPDWRAAVDEWIDTRHPLLSEIRRTLHRHPEPSREEYETSRYLAGQLGQAGVPCRIVPGGRGVLAGPENPAPSGVTAFRADIDALRIEDAKTVPYRSDRPGLMHACGHDAHAAMAAVAAMALWQNRDRLPDDLAWRAIFQPSEEIGEGAFEMIDAGAMQGVKAVIALHVDPTLAAGKIGYRHGVLTAHCQEIEVEINGRGGHAARPHQSIDPISVASQFITSVYQFVPRSVDSRDPVVLTFGSIQGGTSANIIPENVTLKGTIRTLSEASTIAVGEQLKKLADGLSMASGATVRIESRHGTDAVVNDPEVTRACIRAAGEVTGQNHLLEIPLPSMGGEDFSGYLKHAPGCLLRLGAGVPNQPNQFLHSPHFDIDERSLAIGAKLLAHGVVLVSESIKLR